MTGRPTVMTTETLDKLRRAFLMGFTDKEACLYTKIGLQTLYDYQENHKEYSEQKELYKLNPVLKAKRIILRALKKGDLKTAQWYLERKAREEFSNKIKAPVKEIDMEFELDKLEKTDYYKFAKSFENKTDYGELAESLEKQMSEPF